MAKAFTRVKHWRAKDEHTGIAKDGNVPYTYRHLPGRRPPTVRADVYRVETFINFVAPTPIHSNCHYVPGSQVDLFFEGWGEHGETLIDIRPMTMAEALAELEAFRSTAEKGGA